MFLNDGMKQANVTAGDREDHGQILFASVKYSIAPPNGHRANCHTFAARFVQTTDFVLVTRGQTRQIVQVKAKVQ